MKLGIMQPYFFPYIGYFQLMNAVDTFVIYDDVNYIKQGWINRNRILLNGKDFLFTLKLDGASSFKKINEISIGRHNEKLLKTITQAYRQAPYYATLYPIIENIILNTETNLAKYITHSIHSIANYLTIKAKLINSSEINKNNQLAAQEKVIEICKQLGAVDYMNAIGGQELYNKEVFKDANIHLHFLKSNPIQYNQYDNNFVPSLSIIDVMMFNSSEEIKAMLNQYELV